MTRANLAPCPPHPLFPPAPAETAEQAALAHNLSKLYFFIRGPNELLQQAHSISLGDRGYAAAVEANVAHCIEPGLGVDHAPARQHQLVQRHFLALRLCCYVRVV